MNKGKKIISTLAIASMLAGNVLPIASLAATTAADSGVYTTNGSKYVGFRRSQAQATTKLTLAEVVEKVGAVTLLNGKAVTDTTTEVTTGDVVTTADSTYTVVLYGDVDKSGLVDVNDALAIAKHAAERADAQLTGAFLEAANVGNHDGTVDVTDALTVAKYAAERADTNYVIDPMPNDPEQEVPDTFVSLLNDYDVALRALFQEGNLDEAVYKRLEEKIEEAITNINAAKSEDEAKKLYEDMVEEITTKARKTDVQLEIKAEKEKVKKAQQVELAKAILSRFKELAAEEGLSSEINPHISEALKNIESAKTAQDVDNELSNFRSLLNADTYGDLKDKFDDQETLLTEQKNALAELDAYESALDAVQDSSKKAEIENAMKLAREEIMDAKTSARVGEVITGFENLVTANYPTATTSVAKKLVTNARDEAIRQLQAYKTGAYAEEKLVGNNEKTIKKLADEKITALQSAANSLIQSPSVNTNSYKTVNEALKDALDEMDTEIEKIKERMRADQNAYLEAYEAALEELGIYEVNAEKYGLTGEALEYIKAEVAAVKAKIASVDTEGEVNEAMRLFRNGIKQYSPAFDAYQVTETRKAVKAALEEYKELNDASITSKVDEYVEKLPSKGTVNDLKATEREAMNAIEAILKNNELASARLEARKEFLVFIDNDDYSEKVQAIASEAISKITDAYSVADVNTQVAKYKDLIDTQLKEEKTSMQAEIAKARENALKEIAIYEEIATSAEDTAVLNRIAEAKAAISSEDATLKSIETTTNNLIRDIKALGQGIVSAKVEAIEFLKTIGKNYYTSANPEVRKYLKAYTEGNSGSEELSYDKLIKDEYIKGQFENAFNMIKNAEDLEAVTKQRNGVGTESTLGGTTTARGVIVKAIKQDLTAMETARDDAKTKLTALLTDVKAHDDLNDNYTAEIEAVDMTKYMNNPNIFDEILSRAETAVENHTKDLIKSEAQANLNVKDVKEAVEDSLQEEAGGKILGADLDALQKDVSIEVGENGEGVVTGQLHNVTFSGFSNNPDEQLGYFLTLSFDSATAKKVRFTRYNTSGNQEVPTKQAFFDENDRVLTIRFANATELATTKIVIDYYDDANATDESTPVQTITISDFTKLELKLWPDWNN